MAEKIHKFTNIMNEKIKQADDTYIKRINKDKNGNIINKLFFKDVLYSCVHNLSDSIDTVVGTLKNDCNKTVTKNAIDKRRNQISTSIHIRDLNDSLTHEIYDPDNNFIIPNNFKIDRNKKSFIRNTSSKIDQSLYINSSNKRFIGVDGSQLNVNKALINGIDIKSSKNGLYGVCMISGMYDVLNRIPINFQLIESSEEDFHKKKFNETKGFLDQMDRVDNNDVLVFDRLYFSYALHKKLTDDDIGYIFRMKNNSKLFRGMGMGKSKLTDINGVNVQLFKYKIKEELYCILTSITDNISIPEIKSLYWLRWNIETDFRKLKYDILTNYSPALTYNSLMTRLESLRFMSLLSSFVEYAGLKKTPVNKKINSKNCIKILYKCLLHSLIYNIRKKARIDRNIKIIFATLVEIIKNRSYDRVRKSPSTKWNAKGNRYGNG